MNYMNIRKGGQQAAAMGQEGSKTGGMSQVQEVNAANDPTLAV